MRHVGLRFNEDPGTARNPRRGRPSSAPPDRICAPLQAVGDDTMVILPAQASRRLPTALLEHIIERRRRLVEHQLCRRR